MPETPKKDALPVLKPGDSAKIGAKSYALTGDSAGVVLQQVGVVQKTFQLGGLLAKKAQLEAELAAVNELITKHAELSK
jgi:hypothetical protein